MLVRRACRGGEISLVWPPLLWLSLPARSQGSILWCSLAFCPDCSICRPLWFLAVCKRNSSEEVTANYVQAPLCRMSQSLSPALLLRTVSALRPSADCPLCVRSLSLRRSVREGTGHLSSPVGRTEIRRALRPDFTGCQCHQNSGAVAFKTGHVQKGLCLSPSRLESTVSSHTHTLQLGVISP